MKSLTKSQFNALITRLKRDGQLTASGILKEAEKATSPLHGLFEWDDNVAANEYRLTQARQVIKRVNVTIEEPENRVVHIPAIKGEGVYKTVSDAVSNISDFEMALGTALSRLKAAELSVNDLHVVANAESPDKAGMLAIALKGLETASAALEKLH